MHLSRVMGTHYGVFRIGSHTQRGTLGPINGPTASMVFSTVSLCGFFFSMFLWIYLYHFFFYHFISIGVVVFMGIYFCCVYTHILCVWGCSLSTLLVLTQTHTFCACGVVLSPPFYFWYKHIHFMCVVDYSLSTHTHTHSSYYLPFFFTHTQLCFQRWKTS
jgi:hypothetical protein